MIHVRNINPWCYTDFVMSQKTCFLWSLCSWTSFERLLLHAACQYMDLISASKWKHVTLDPVFIPLIWLWLFFPPHLSSVLMYSSSPLHKRWHNFTFTIIFQVPTTMDCVRLKWWTNRKCSFPPGLCCLPIWSRWVGQEPFPPPWCTTGRNS